MFLQMFSFHHWFLLLFFGCFHCSLHLFFSPTLEFFYHCFHMCFYFITDFYYCFSGGFISLTFYHDCFFVRYFSFVLLYRECYGFEKAFFSLSFFLTYTPSPHFPWCCRCYWFKRAFFYSQGFFPYTPSRHLAQHAFIKASMGACSFSLKVAWPPIEVQKTDPAHLFVWIT